MSPVFTTLLALMIVCVACMAACGVMITAFLEKRGVKTPFYLMRWYVIRNLSRYREVTMQEIGKPGALYYWYIAFALAALMFAIAMIVARILGA